MKTSPTRPMASLRVSRDRLKESRHNHVRRETHDGEALWVHRKGAISAALASRV